MPIFRRKKRPTERAIPEPDWALVTDRLDAGEEEIDACKGWSIARPLDHPCAIYLTDRSIYVDIRPDLSASGAETIAIPFSAVARCGVAPSDLGTPRLVIVFDPIGDADPEDIRVVGVDLRPEKQGWVFGERVVDYVEAGDRQREVLEGEAEPSLVRHVELHSDGKGATFELRIVDGSPKWSWSYDPGIPDDLNTTMATEAAIAEMERERGLPLTFPYLDPDREREDEEEEEPETEEEREQRLADLLRGAAEGQPSALRALWYETGTPVTNPDELVEGTIYCVPCDLAIYRGSFIGRKFEGTPSLDHEPGVDEWFTFESAQRTAPWDIGKDGTRTKREDFPSPQPLDGEATAVLPPAPQEDVRTAFDELRADHLEWERNRPPQRYH